MKPAPESNKVVFQPSEKSNRRLKALFFGPPGTAKTTTAIQFDNAAVIDLEGGAEHYGGKFKFHVLKTTTVDQVDAAIDWLLSHPHEFRTLVFDPITQYWDSLQKKYSDIFLRRNKGSKGHHGDYYDLQVRDWITIKAAHKEMVRKLIQLDMNVIVTARQKPMYAEHGFMRQIGETFDGEKSLPYLFDTILRLYKDDKGHFMAENLKDRTNKLPQGHFEFSYQILEDRFGKDALGRKAVPIQEATASQLNSLRHLIADSGMKEETVQNRLAAYGADSIEALTQKTAQQIIDKLNAAGIPSAKPDTSIKEDSDAKD